jgi:hypothetical protein
MQHNGGHSKQVGGAHLEAHQWEEISEQTRYKFLDTTYMIVRLQIFNLYWKELGSGVINWRADRHSWRGAVFLCFLAF